MIACTIQWDRSPPPLHRRGILKVKLPNYCLFIFMASEINSNYASNGHRLSGIFVFRGRLRCELKFGSLNQFCG